MVVLVGSVILIVLALADAKVGIFQHLASKTQLFFIYMSIASKKSQHLVRKITHENDVNTTHILLIQSKIYYKSANKKLFNYLSSDNQKKSDAIFCSDNHKIG